MRHWKRSVSQVSNDIEEFLRAEIKLRWPEREYPFHIEVVGSEGTTNLEVRVWDSERVHVVHNACPTKFPNSPSKSPTVGAILHAIEAALVDAKIQNAR